MNLHESIRHHLFCEIFGSYSLLKDQRTLLMSSQATNIFATISMHFFKVCIHESSGGSILVFQSFPLAVYKFFIFHNGFDLPPCATSTVNWLHVQRVNFFFKQCILIYYISIQQGCTNMITKDFPSRAPYNKVKIKIYKILKIGSVGIKKGA